MQKDQASDVGSQSRPFDPYSSHVTQHGQIGVSSAGAGPSRTMPVMPPLPAAQQRSVVGVRPQAAYPPHTFLGDGLASAHWNPSGCQWMQYPPPPASYFSINLAHNTPPSQWALTASQPPPQPAPMGNLAARSPPFERRTEGRRNPVGTDFGTTPSTYRFAQVSPSNPPHLPVEAYPVLARSTSAGWVQDPEPIMSNPPPQAPAAPPAPFPRRSPENQTQLGRGSMLGPSHPLQYSPYPLPSPFPPFSPYPQGYMNQFFPYANMGIFPQRPVAPMTDIPPKPLCQWTAGNQELRANSLPLTYTRATPSSPIPSVHWHPPPEARIPPQLQQPPQTPGTRPARNPQRQWSHFPDLAQPGHAYESLPLDPSVDVERSSRSYLRNAHHFQMGDLHHLEAPNATHVTNNTNTTVVNSGPIDGWKILQGHTAPNALHNSSARYDAPKCDEDTRVEVTAEITGWIKDRAHPQRILCMTGAAGAGKSALQQSIAACCAKGNILGGAYFISAADTSRNTASTIVPTIAYQLGLKHSTLQRSIAAAVEHDSLIFSQSLETQMDVLIVRPFESLRRSRACDMSTFPYAILIDGLDECQGELITTADLDNSNTAAKRRAEDRQAELLAAIRNTLLNHDLPFRIFIASRPEWAIHTALGTRGSLDGLAYHIPLSDKYDATEDMRRYLRRRFEDIGLRIDQPHWFTEGDIDTLVRAGSGQFVYVATVYKYVSERQGSPVQRLQTVLNWTPGQVTRPFEALDMLYRNILLSAKEAYEAVDTHSGRDFLLLLKIYLLQLDSSFPSTLLYGSQTTDKDVVTAFLDLEGNALEILTLDLRSLVYLEGDEPGSRHLAAYHKSLYDFMDEKSRAKDMFVPVRPLSTHLAKCCTQRIIEIPESELYTPSLVRWTDCSASFSKRCVSLAIYCLDNYLPGANVDDEIVDFTHKGGWQKIDTVLCKHSGFNIIFGDWELAMGWARDLIKVAKVLKKRRPDSEAGEIMREYAEKWKNIAKPELGDGYPTDVSAESNDEASDSDSD